MKLEGPEYTAWRVSIDDETEATDPVFVEGDEKAPLLGAGATSATRRGDHLDEAGVLVRGDRRRDDPIIGVLLLEGAPILLADSPG